MRLSKISFKGVTRFDERVTLDLDDLAEGLIALVGDNGSGKTTCLEAAIAALYRTFPSRPGWYDNFNGRDAFIEATFWDLGFEIRVQLAVDEESRKTEQYVTVNGEAVTSGRAKDAAEEIEKRFGSLRLLLASTFASQGKQGNFLLLPKGERKALMIELLGLSRLEYLHERAKEQRSHVDNRLLGLRGRLESEESNSAEAYVVRREISDTELFADDCADTVQAARVEEKNTAVALASAKEAAEKVASERALVEAARRELAAAESSLKESRAATDRIKEESDRRLESINSVDPDAEEKRARDRHRREILSIVEAELRLDATIERAADVDEATKQIAILEDELAQLLEKERKMENLERYAERMETEREGLQGETALLEKVPCTEAQEWIKEWPRATWSTGDTLPVALSDSCPLLAKARDAKAKLESLPDDVEAKLSAARADFDPESVLTVRALIRAQSTIAAGISAILLAKSEREKLELAETRANETFDAELARVSSMADRIAADTVAVKRDALERMRETISKRKGIEEDILRLGAHLRDAEALLSRSREVAMECGATASAEQHHIAAVSALSEAEGVLRGAELKLSALKGKLEVLREREADLELTRNEITAAETDLGDWGLLARAMGRDGIQALEIDASGPGVASITNELLESCYGTRFTISFETLREKTSARGEFSEVFDVKVRDRGVERPAEALSGGERVVVGEAIGLALSIFNARRSGIRWRTLFRDETAGALDASSAQAYVDMLRRAMSVGEFEQVLFVSHQREVWERADARLLVEGGRVGIQRAPQ